MISSLLDLANRFKSNIRGNVAMIAAICAVPLFGLLGFAVDYGTALADKAKLDAAADEATIVAIKTVQTVMQGGGTFAAGQSEGIAQANAAFKAAAGKLGFTTIPAIAPVISQDPDDIQKITANISYTTPMPTNFSKIVGVSTVNIAGSSTASLSLTTFIRVYVVVDVSQSMGIVANPSDMTAMYQRVVSAGNGSDNEVGCVFGCHVTTGSQTVTNEYLAHNISPAIELRIDAAISAIQAVITQAHAASASTNNIQIGIYTISLNPTQNTSYINMVAPPSSVASTSDYNAMLAFAALPNAGNNYNGIDLGANTASGTGDSTFSQSLQDFISILGPKGTGLSASSPQNFVILVTDGVQDTAGCPPLGHCVSVLDTSMCSQIKNNATLGVVYTTYNPIYANNDSSSGQLEQNYANLVAPIAPYISSNLQTCATPSTPNATYFYEASDGTTLVSAMQKLFASTTQVARITN